MNRSRNGNGTRKKEMKENWLEKKKQWKWKKIKKEDKDQTEVMRTYAKFRGWQT